LGIVKLTDEILFFQNFRTGFMGLQTGEKPIKLA
jgi:hypothetical protein